MSLIDLAERRWLPDWLIRAGIRRLLRKRLSNLALTAGELHDSVAQQLGNGPVAIATDKANEQHYEVPPEFFQLVLGPRCKYSCCLFDDAGNGSLLVAENHMLDVTCRRAEIEDGMRVLELGCGWGSLSLWMAENFPASRITAVSNSAGQRQFIERQCRERGLDNLQVITADMRDFDIDAKFDRVVSVEMFEHMRNYRELLRRIAGWLEPSGKLFVHLFCHRSYAYPFETDGASDWMARHFFTGGIMPSADLLGQFSRDLCVGRQWQVDGNHYGRTCEAWLEKLDQNRDLVLASLGGAQDPRLAMQRWRIFFMSCAELFRFNAGREWFVGHYLLSPTVRRKHTHELDSTHQETHCETPESVR